MSVLSELHVSISKNILCGSIHQEGKQICELKGTGEHLGFGFFSALRNLNFMYAPVHVSVRLCLNQASITK